MTTAAQMAKARAATAQRQKDVEAAVAGIEFPLPRPEGLTRQEIKERAKAVEDAVAGIEWAPLDASKRDADRRATAQRQKDVDAAVRRIKP